MDKERREAYKEIINDETTRLGAKYKCSICWVDLNPGLSHIESGSPSSDSVAALIGGAPHFHG
jgi:hypothetical protein